MNKYWVVSENYDWADEFDVFFFDIYTDREKNNINWIGKLFPNLRVGYCFGTNEWFDPEEGFAFEITGMPATDEEVQILKKFNVRGESVRREYDDWLFEHIDSKTRNNWQNKYNSLLDVPENIFQAYEFKLTENDFNG